MGTSSHPARAFAALARGRRAAAPRAGASPARGASSRRTHSSSAAARVPARRSTPAPPPSFGSSSASRSRPPTARSTSSTRAERSCSKGAGRPDPADPRMLVAAAPSMPDGSYSVTWRSLSAADGHTAEGFFTFAVGGGGVIAGHGHEGGATHGHDESPAERVLAIAARSASFGGLMLAFGVALLALLLRRVHPRFVALAAETTLGPAAGCRRRGGGDARDRGLAAARDVRSDRLRDGRPGGPTARRPACSSRCWRRRSPSRWHRRRPPPRRARRGCRRCRRRPRVHSRRQGTPRRSPRRFRWSWMRCISRQPACGSPASSPSRSSPRGRSRRARIRRRRACSCPRCRGSPRWRWFRWLWSGSPARTWSGCRSVLRLSSAPTTPSRSRSRSRSSPRPSSSAHSPTSTAAAIARDRGRSGRASPRRAPSRWWSSSLAANLTTASPPGLTLPVGLAVAAGSQDPSAATLALQPGRPGPNGFVVELSTQPPGAVVDLVLQRLDAGSGEQRIRLRALDGSGRRFGADGGLLPANQRMGWHGRRLPRLGCDRALPDPDSSSRSTQRACRRAVRRHRSTPASCSRSC